MAWDDTKVAQDDFLSADWNDMVTDQKTRAPVTSGSGAPLIAPAQVGAIYIDTGSSPKRMYIAMGTNVADWKKVMSQ